MDHFNKVVVVGSLAFDHVMSLPGRMGDFIQRDKIDRLNVSFTVDSLRKEFGGTGGNCAFSLGLFGLQPMLVSAWGHDAEAYKEHLDAVRVNTEKVVTDEELYSAWGHVMTDIEENQLWMFYPGAMRKLSEINLKEIVQPGDLVALLPSQPDVYFQHVQQLSEMEGVAILFDPAFFIPNMFREQLQLGIEKAAIVIGNDYEIDAMEKKLGNQVEDWLQGDRVVVETRSKKGSVIWQGDHMWQIPAVIVEDPKDPTGAGDAFRSGFLAGYMKGLSLEVCGRMGALVAAISVEKPGTQTHWFDVPGFKERYREEYKEELPWD